EKARFLLSARAPANPLVGALFVGGAPLSPPRSPEGSAHHPSFLSLRGPPRSPRCFSNRPFIQIRRQIRPLRIRILNQRNLLRSAPRLDRLLRRNRLIDVVKPIEPNQHRNVASW